MKYFGSFSGKVSKGHGACGSTHTPGEPRRMTPHCRSIVALVAHDVHDHGGMERVCAELIRRGASEVDFVVVSVTLAPDLRPLVADWIQVRVPPRPFPLKFMFFWLLAGRRIRSLDVDLVHTVGAIVPNPVDVAAIHHCHAGFISVQGRLAPHSAPFIRRVNTSITRLLALSAERWSYRPSRLRAFAAVSDGVRDELRLHYPGISVQVTPNGVDLDRFQPRPSVREELRVDQNARDSAVALFVGGNWDHKGLDIALEAIALLQARGHDVRLWVVGDGERQCFDELAQTLNISSCVQFFGRRVDTERFYTAADALVFPTSYEAFSLVTLEAAASGLPVIMPRVNGASDIVGNNEAGLLVDLTADSVAAAFASLVDDAELRVRLGRQARKRATRYAWDDSIEAVTQLYSSLLRDGTCANDGG